MAYKDRHNIARRTRNPQSDTRLSFVQLESVLKVTTHEYHQPTCMCNNNMYKRDTNNQHVCATTCTREIPTTNMYVYINMYKRDRHIFHAPLRFLAPPAPLHTSFPNSKQRWGHHRRPLRERTEREQRENRERTEREQRERSREFRVY
jgi:hypothetical protein